MLHAHLHLNEESRVPIRCEWAPAFGGGHFVLSVGPTDIFARADQLEELRGRIDAALQAREACRCRPLPAEAATWVPAGGWGDDDATPEEMELAHRSRPEIVP
jgi:hypothetical protein